MSVQRMRANGAIRIAAIAASVLIVLTACSGTGGKPRSTGGGMNAGQADTPRFTIAMVTHGPPGDTFWDLIRKGAETAAAKDNIELKYSAELQGPDQANLVQNAIDSKVDALAVTLAKPDALAGAVKSASGGRIPVVAFNAGIDAWQASGAKAYFGQDEKISGEAAGKRLASEGAKKVVCIIQDQGNVALESRCAGVKAGFGGPWRTSTSTAPTCRRCSPPSLLSCSRTRRSTTSSRSGRRSRWRRCKSGATAGSDAKIGTFDTNAELVDAIKSGTVQWAVDQQPFLQGYLAVDSLWLYLNNRNTIGGGHARADRPGVHRQDEHRRDRRVREERHALMKIAPSTQ